MVSVPVPKTSSKQLVLNNITEGETVYQRCLLIAGNCPSKSNEDFVAVATPDFPEQLWPISAGRFKCLVILSPGANLLTFKSHQNGKIVETRTLTITYIPLLQTPPLHLAIMIAKDSPLLIDCPPHKRGAISSTHSDLNAAINKFRMTAYMWQALTAEDLRSKGLGRRSFRLDEEWTTETLSRDFIQKSLESSEDHMRSTAKIHLIRTEKTLAQLRDAQVAQQNPHASHRDDLHKYFSEALTAHGGVFTSAAHPVVAGLILDSTYSAEQNLILGHAALGASNRQGLSLGMFGSHLTYSWPRFMEEVTSCLLDTVVPGDTVGNDNGECGTMWETCSIGQGAFLHEVGHAFGAPHTTGIMARGYAQDWPKNFLTKTAYCSHTQSAGDYVVDGETKNDASWDLSDALSFRTYPHFRLPGDAMQSKEVCQAVPSVQVVYEEGEAEFMNLVIESPAQIARIKFDSVAEAEPTIDKPATKIQFTRNELEARFDFSKPLALEVLGLNGKSRVFSDIWKLFSNLSVIPVPGTSIVLHKRSIISESLEAADETTFEENSWNWVVLLKKLGAGGSLIPAVKIDSRVGCILDGAVVYYKDGNTSPCGPRWNYDGYDHDFGGHASEMITIPESIEVVKVEVSSDGHDLNGLRFTLSDGTAGGHIPESTCSALEASADERIVGFFGRSDWGSGFDGIQEFGILTAPRDVEIPLSVYSMRELQNKDGGNGKRGHLKRKRSRIDNGDDDQDDSDFDEMKD
ncbi:hypothetical protein BP6252_05668 [Coleophoma cylindrospora]|uniref:Jacalin-type lectin domain-containing protein n=1 Tax=Coleophoma cylindrospora TaxID=1849047 RepID=A0A3D8RUD1_9HELO|nr:hypothetical protein BP6252_05668 [Coleophoma cylindrospora]